jgi:predicted nucleic-acid-binding protein
VKALDTNVLVRFLINDDPEQGARVRTLFEDAEAEGVRFLISRAVLLELIWVLSAVYEFTRGEVLEAVELLTRLSVLEFDDLDGALTLVRLGRSTRADLADLVIGLAAHAKGCETTLTFEKGLEATRLFQRL